MKAGNKNQQLTFLFYRMLIITALIPYASILPGVPSSIAGFNFSGWAWMLMFITCLAMIFYTSPLKFPLIFWIPWLGYITLYALADFSFNGVQLTLQYMTPIFTGVIASKLYYDNDILARIFNWGKWYLGFIILYYLLGIYYNLSGFVPHSYGGVAGTAMTVCIFGSIMMSIYFHRNRFLALAVYLVILLLPMMMVNRMGIAMLLLVAPLHFAPVNAIKRIFIISGIIIAGVLIFYSAPFQKKMFHSGEGKLTDVSFQNQDFQTSGRNFLSLVMQEKMAKAPMLGYGPREDLKLFISTNIDIREAHNDYLAVRYNYGWVGLILLLFGFIGTFLALLRLKTRRMGIPFLIVYHACLTLFIVWAGFMATDNVLKYSTFFGNFHFAMIGLVFSYYRRMIFKPATPGQYGPPSPDHRS